jgi:Spy/CpxP family protein refolding chaperone
MKRNIVYSAAIILTVINLAALATLLYSRWTNTQSPSTFDLRNQRFDQLKRELELSPGQVAQLGVSRTELHAGIDSLSARLVAARTALAHALLEDKLDTTSVNSTLQEIGRLQASAQKKVISHLLSVKSILNPVQQDKFSAIVLDRFASATDQPLPGRPSH